MKIQVSTDYAIRILIYLNENKEGIHTAHTISQAVKITYPFFIKIAKQLKDNGLVKTVQGRHGGYRLGKSEHVISIYDVYLAIEGELRLNRCLEEEWSCTNGNKKHCKVHKFLYGLQHDVLIAQMSKTRISDLTHSGERETEKDYSKNRIAAGQDLQNLQAHFETIA